MSRITEINIYSSRGLAIPSKTEQQFYYFTENTLFYIKLIGLKNKQTIKLVLCFPAFVNFV